MTQTTMTMTTMTTRTSTGRPPFPAAMVQPGNLADRWAQLRAHLFAPVDATSLAIFRIAFGLIMLWEVWRYFSYGWITRYYVDPILFFSYIPGVTPWPGDGMYWHFGLMGVLAVLIAVGLWYRVAAVLFWLSFTYVFLLDKANYLNHFYLVSLMSLLLAVVPAQRGLSLERLFGRSNTPAQVPRWSLWLLRSQIVIVYFYGGIAKLNGDWLQGAPLDSWLAVRSSLPLIGPLLAQPWSGVVFAYGGLLIDLSVGWLLLWGRTFLLGVLVALMFNLLNAYIFSIGIFPYFMLAACVLFAPPHWFRRQAYAAPIHTPQRRDTLLLAAIACYLLVQLVVPLRHWAYPGDVAWTEEGHRFSWRMKLRDKEANAVFSVVDPRTGEVRPLYPEDWLTLRQASKMPARPDMVLQFAHAVADVYEEEYGVRPRIYGDVWASLNGRPPQPLIDPMADLAAQPPSLWPAHWIMR